MPLSWYRPTWAAANQLPRANPRNSQTPGAGYPGRSGYTRRIPAGAELYRQLDYPGSDLHTTAGTRGPPVDGRLGRLAAGKTGIHPVLVAGIAQFELVDIHPFLDGNGRTARLLSTLCLYRTGYDFKRLFTISEYYDRNRPPYYRALQGAREQNLDLTGWLEYFTAGLGAQLSEVQARGEGLIRQDVLALRYGLSGRQKQAIQLAGEKGTFGIQDFEQICPGLTRRTLQRELKELVEKGVLRVEGATRNLSYSLVEEV